MGDRRWGWSSCRTSGQPMDLLDCLIRLSSSTDCDSLPFGLRTGPVERSPTDVVVGCGSSACGDVAASFLIGLGLSAVISGRPTRRQGSALVGAGVVWCLFIVAIGSGKGSSLAGNYGYLAHVSGGTGIGATFSVLWGIAITQLESLTSLVRRRDDILKFFWSSGTIGFFSAIGLGITSVVIIPNALNQSPVFIGAAAAFQNLAAVVFLLVGVVTFLTWIVRRGRYGPALVWIFGLIALLQILSASHLWIPRIAPMFLKVNQSTAQDLTTVLSRTDPHAEVIASQGTIGRFGARKSVYPYLNSFADGQTIPIDSRQVVFVFVPHQGIEAATPEETEAAINVVRSDLHATPILATSNVTAFAWNPPHGVTSVHFPR